MNFEHGFDAKAISQTIMVVASIAIIVIAGASAFYVLSNQTGRSNPHRTIQQTSSPNSGGVSTNSSTSTQSLSTYGNRHNSIWNFTVITDYDFVYPSTPIAMSAQITNIGDTNQTIKNFIGPYINPMITSFAPNGAEVWAWDPPQVTYLNWTIGAGETLTQNLTIPTSSLSFGQIFFIHVVPLFNQSSSANLGITLEFQVGYPSSGPTSQGSNLLSCEIQSYTVWSVEYINNSTTTGGVSTQSSNTSYTTTTTITETVGYITTAANNFTGTLTGAKAEWTVTACTYVTSK